MSINIDGNKITKFGHTLPTPYFDKIEVKDEQIIFYYSYYFAKPEAVEDAAFEAYINATLDKLQTMIFLMPKFNCSTVKSTNAFDTVTRYPDPLPHKVLSDLFIINERFNVKEALHEDSRKIYDLARLTYQMATHGVYKLAITDNGKYKISPESYTGYNGLFLESFTNYFNEEKLYDTNGSEVRRYLYSTPISLPNVNGHMDTYSPIEAVARITGIELDALLASTSLPLDDLTALPSIFDGDQLSTNEVTFRNLYAQQISDINCETIASAGTFKSQPERIYRFVESGLAYTTGDVLKSIDSRYYAIDEVIRKNIIDNVRRVIQTGYKLPSGGTVAVNRASVNNELENKQFNSARNNVSHVLEVYGSSRDLIPELNKALSAFPTTSTVNRTGRLHEKLEIAIFNANSEVKNTGVEVVKQINLNTFVKDLRTSPVYVVTDRFKKGANHSRIDLNSKDQYIYTSAMKYGCYTDPCSYGQEMFIPTFTNYIALPPRSEEVTSSKIKDIIGTSITPGNFKSGRRLLFNWFKKNLKLGAGGAGRDNYPTDSDYGKIIQFFGDPANLYTAYKIIAHMALIGGGEERSQTPVQMSTYVTGLSTAAKFSTSAGGGPTIGWHIPVTAFDGNAPQFTTGTRYAEKLVEEFTPFQLYGVHTPMNDEDTEFHDTSVQHLHFYAETTIRFHSYAMAFYVINKIVENTEYALNSYNSYLFGYWWFDYEKALKERSAISYVYSLSKLESFFDRNIANQYFRLMKTDIERHFFRDDEDKYMSEIMGQAAPLVISMPDEKIKIATLTSVYSTSGTPGVSNNEVKSGYRDFPEGVSYDTSMISSANTIPRGMEIKVTQHNPGDMDEDGRTDVEDIEDDGAAAIGQIGVDVANNDSEEYTYSVIRNFKPIEDPDTDNYRLMCFEHQEVAGVFNNNTIYNESEFPYSGLVHSVTIKDSTPYLVWLIADSYQKLLYGEFEDYYQAAIEQCSYNSNDEKFSDFFKTGAKQAHSERPDLAPWFRMPVMYHYHVDLLYDAHGGSTDAIFAAAMIDSEKLAPDTGMLEMLIAFREKARSLFEDEYNSISNQNSVLSRINDAMGTSLVKFEDLSHEPAKQHVFNGPANTQIAFTDIPAPINLVNTLKYDDPIDPTEPTSLKENLENFAQAVLKIATFWQDDPNNSFRQSPEPFSDDYIIVDDEHNRGWKTIEYNAWTIASIVWTHFTDIAGEQEIRTEDDIGVLATYAGFTQTGKDSTAVGTNSIAQRVFDIREAIKWGPEQRGYSLMHSLYQEETHPIWTTSTDELPMVEFYTVINDAISLAVMIGVNMARSTYKFITTGNNGVGDDALTKVKDLKDYKISIGYGDVDHETQFTVLDYMDEEFKHIIGSTLSFDGGGGEGGGTGAGDSGSGTTLPVFQVTVQTDNPTGDIQLRDDVVIRTEI